MQSVYNCYDFRGCFGYNWSSKTEVYRIARQRLDDAFLGVAICKKFYGWCLDTRVLNMPEKNIAH